MKSPGLIIAILLVAGIAVSALFVVSQSSTNNPVETANQMLPGGNFEQGEGNPVESAPVTEYSGSPYTTFSPETFAATAGERRVLFFYANWCPTCAPANASFTSESVRIPEDVVVLRVNYNDDDTDETEEELAKWYDVTYQHTFVQVDSSGNEVAKWNGGAVEELLTNLK